jgi:hypothetical protein
MSTQPPLTQQPSQAVMNQIDLVYAKSLDPTMYEVSKTQPGEGFPVFTSTTALFQFEIQTGGVIALVNELSKSVRLVRFYDALVAGRGPTLITQLAEFGQNPAQWLWQQAADGIAYWPASIVPPNTSISIDPGNQGAVSLPGVAPIPGVNPSAWPTTVPSGWIPLPSAAQWNALLAPGANVTELIAKWF